MSHLVVALGTIKEMIFNRQESQKSKKRYIIYFHSSTKTKLLGKINIP